MDVLGEMVCKIPGTAKALEAFEYSTFWADEHRRGRVMGRSGEAGEEAVAVSG